MRARGDAVLLPADAFIYDRVFEAVLIVVEAAERGIRKRCRETPLYLRYFYRDPEQNETISGWITA